MTKGIQRRIAAPKKTARLKADLFRTIANRSGWESNAAIANATGVSPQLVGRILSGKQPPTIEFVCGFLDAVPEAGFRRTFDIVPATDTTKEVAT